MPLGRFAVPGLLFVASSAYAAEPPQAASAGATKGDHSLVILRAVHPRVAYRGMPADRLQIASQVELFPTGAFERALGGASAVHVTDDLLAGTASQMTGALRTVDAVMPLLGAGLAHPGAQAGSTPLGAGAQAGPGVAGITAGLGSFIGQAVSGAVKAGGGP